MMLKSPSTKFLDPNPEVDDFQNFISSYFFLVHGYICGKNFREDPFLRTVANRQTNQQTNAG